MAQRMEPAAPPGGVMLSESTAMLVAHCANLVEPELVRIKGGEDPVAARRLLGIGPRRADRVEARLVGRHWEMAALDGIVQRAIQGRGGAVSLVGPAGIGKRRLAREVAAMAAKLLLRRGESDDLAEAGAAVDRLSAVPADPGFLAARVCAAAAAGAAGARTRR
jgi:hypothetical protein